MISRELIFTTFLEFYWREEMGRMGFKDSMAWEIEMDTGMNG